MSSRTPAATRPSSIPATGETYAQAPISDEQDVDGAYRAAAAAFEEWRDATPAERQLALLRFADAIEARADEFVAPRARTPASRAPSRPRRRSRRWSTRSGSSPVPRACSRAARPASTCAGNTSMIRREPIGVVRAGHAVELPDDDGGVEVRPGDRRRQHASCSSRATRRRPRTLLMAEVAARVPAAGRLQRHLRRPRHRSRARRSTRRRRWWRSPARCAPGMEVATAAAADLKRVHLELGGKAPVDRLRRRRHRPRRPRAIAVAGYFNAGQDCTAATRVIAAPGVYGDFVDALAEQATRHQDGAARRRGRRLRPAQQRQPARAGERRSSTPLPDHAQRRHRRAPHRRARASSSSPRSSPTSARTTR